MLTKLRKKLLILIFLPLTLVAQAKDKKEVTQSDSLLTLLVAQKKIYDAQNEKAYLKQKYDTMTLFSALKNMFTTAETLDSLEMKLAGNTTSKHKVKYRIRHAEILNEYRSNLYAAGIFFFNKQDYQRALDYYETYLNCASQPLFADYHYRDTDTTLFDATYGAMAAASALMLPDKVISLSELALKKHDREEVLMLLLDAYREKKDETNLRRILTYGLAEYPQSMYFRYSKSLQDLIDGNLDNAISISKEIISEDPMLPRPYYVAGLACLRKIDRYGAKEKKHKKELYLQALVYLEKYKELSPTENRSWAPLLYRVYYNLNLDAQFREMERLLTK